jgi:hypothetical protein
VPFALVYFPALSGAGAAGYAQPGLASMVDYCFVGGTM